eukprot:PITA_17894
MEKFLQKHNLGDHIAQGAKKKTKDPPHGKGNNFHVLVAINSSHDAWIIDSSASHHMAVTKEFYSSLYACKGPPILMGDDSPIEVIRRGRVELLHGSFEDVLHVPKLSVNLLLVYRITHSDTRKRVEFILDAVNIYDLHNNFKIATGEVNNEARLYTFSKFIESESSLLLTHADDSSRLWNERFGHLNYRNKSKVFAHFEDFKALVETQSERKIKALHIDNGGEYVNKALQNLFPHSSAQMQYTVTYTPQQNRVAERKNQSLKEMASSMLHPKSLPHKTPFSASSGTKPEVTHFCVFGSRAWARIPFEKRKALDPQSIECIFVGYPDEHVDSTVEHADVETECLDTNPVHAYDDPHPSPDQASSSESNSLFINQRKRSLHDIYAQDHQATINGLVGDNSDLQGTSSEFIEPPLALTATKPSPSWHCHLVQSSDPQSYAEASRHSSWESTMEEEYNSLLENQTWDLVPLPSGRKLVRCKWLYRTESAADGQITRQKARLVVEGLQQVHGIN